MNILFIAKHKWPRIGGVERHHQFLIRNLKFLIKNIEITTISEEDIKPPHIKIFGLLYIWYWFLKNINLIKNSDIVHIHDVFIWYLPFRFIFPRKKVYITFHGWEGKWPLPMWTILNKRIANFLCNGSIVVGNYINKYYGIKSNYTTYGGVEKLNDKKLNAKSKSTVVWLGRQDKDTGYFEFRKWLKDHSDLKVKYVTNDPNPEKYLITSEYCAPSGYLSYLEAKNYGCKILTFSNNPLKIDYWKEIRDIYDDKFLKKITTWNEVVNIYMKLWGI